MSSDRYDDDEYDDEEELEEWEYFEEEEREALRDRVSIKDIIKLVLLFGFFACFFLYFKYWDFFVKILSFGDSEMGRSRLIFLTVVFFPFLAAFFLTGLVKVSKALFIPQKETPIED